MDTSLRKKLLITITVLLLFFGLLAILVINRYSNREVLNLEKNNLEVITIQKTREINQIFSNTRELVRTISNHVEIVDYMASQNKEQQPDNIKDYLELYNIGDSFLAIYLMDKDGYTWASTDSSFVGKNYAFREYFKEAITSGSYVDIVRGVTSGEVGYYFSQVIKDKQNNVLGVAVAKMKPEGIHSVLDLNFLGHIMFTDEHGIIVYSDRKDRIYKSLGILSDEYKQIIEDGQRFSGLEITPLQYGILQDNLQEIISSKTFEYNDLVDGEKEILSVARIENSQFFIIAEEEFELFANLAQRISYLLATFVLAALLLAILLTALVIRKFLQPLEPLKEAAVEVSKGNYDYYVYVDSKDKGELVDLARSFNKMVRQVKKEKEGVEKKVRDRTAQLEKINKFMTGRELKMVELKKKVAALENKKTKSK